MVIGPNAHFVAHVLEFPRIAHGVAGLGERFTCAARPLDDDIASLEDLDVELLANYLRVLKQTLQRLGDEARA